MDNISLEHVPVRSASAKYSWVLLFSLSFVKVNICLSKALYLLIQPNRSPMNQSMTAAMTSAERSEPAARDPISVAEFRGWLARAESCSWFEYYRGLLLWDRSPASELSEDERWTVAKIADAALTAAADGLVHLVQHRNGPFDFSYVAIKAAPARSERARRPLANVGVGDLPAAA